MILYKTLEHTTCRQLCLALAYFLTTYSSTAQSPVQSNVTAMYNRFYLQSFPILDLETPDSTIFNTRQLKGKTVYVDFWFTTCPPCLKEIPYSTALQQYFASDTNIVFLNICIENVERKQQWKQMVASKPVHGINVFYAKNRPQKINLLRSLGVDNFPMYLLVNNMQVLGYNAPPPSDKGFVHWAIYQATYHISLADSYTGIIKKSASANEYLRLNWKKIEALEPAATMSAEQ